MTCLDFEDRQNQLLDRRQHELPEELAAHITHCAVCCEMHRQMNQMQAAAASWRDSLPIAPLTDSVLQRLQMEQAAVSGDFVIRTSRPASRESHVPSHRHSPIHRGSALLVAALTLVIAAGIGWRVSYNVSFAKRQGSSANQIAVTPMPRPETAIPLEHSDDRQLDVLLHDARDAYVALASQAWQQVSTAEVLLPPGDMLNPFDGQDSADEVSESLSRPLAPLGRELRDAVDAWFQQLFNNQDPST